MAITADKVVVELEARIGEYERRLDQAERSFKGNMASMRTQAGLTEKSTVKSFAGVTTASTAMSASLRSSALALASVAGAAAGIRVLAEFAQAMSTVKAVTQATDSQFDSLEKKARQLGATTRFSATQAAEGMLFLARAGFDTDQVLGSIEGTLQLAQAGALSLGSAADIASNVLQGFRLEVSETARVVDVLALAANSSNTDVTQLGEAMKYAAPIAAGLGVGVEQTAAAISALSDAGLQGSTAGTGLRRVMIGLEKQSSQGEKVLKKYGLTMMDVAMSTTGSLANSLERLADAGISTADAITLFGLRGGPAFEVLQSSIPKVRELTDAYDNAGGTAKRVAEVMDANLNGALLGTKSRLEELILALGEAGAEDALIIALEGLQKLLTLAAENADILTVALVALSIRGLLPLITAVGSRLLASLAALQLELFSLALAAGTVGGTLTGVAGAVATAFGPATIAIAAAAAAYVLLARNAKEGRDAIERAKKTVEGINKALSDTEDFKPFETMANDAEFAIPIVERLRDTVQGLADALFEVAGNSLISQAGDVSKQINDAKAELEDLKRRRDTTLNDRRVNAAASESRSGRKSEINTNTDYDKQISELVATVANLERRAAAIGKASFGDGGVDIIAAFRDGGQIAVDKAQEASDKVLSAAEESAIRLKGGSEAVSKALDQRFTDIKNAGVIEKELKNIETLSAALDDAKARGVDSAVERFKEQISIAEATIELLKKGIDEGTARELARESVQQDKGGETELDKQTKKALDEIKSAYNDTFETEREQIARIRDERIKAIEDAGLAQSKADALTAQAKEIYKKQLADIRAQEGEDFTAYLDEQQAKADKERSLVDEIIQARDEMLGRSSALLDREYELRKIKIEKEIKDEERKKEALTALDEEYAASKQELEDKALGNGQFSESEVERIRAAQQDQLDLLEDWFADKLDREQEYLDRRTEINANADAQITALRQQAAIAQLDAVEQGLSAATSLAKRFAGENSGIYKALFLAEKAAALASAYVQMNLATAKAAAAAPPPFNAPLIASARITGLATIAGIAAATISGFADGVVDLKGKGTAKSDSNLALISNGESVITAEGTRKNKGLLTAANKGIDVEAQLSRIYQPSSVSQSFLTSGGRTISVAGASLVIQGNVTPDSMPALQAAIDQLNREMDDRVFQALNRDRLATEPRHTRNEFMRK